MLIPSTITARRTRGYTSTWYIHPTTHKHDFEPMDGRGRYIFQPPQVTQSIRPGGPLQLRLLPSADGLPEMPEASDLAWAMTGAHEENPVRSRMEHTGETARQRARPPGP